MKPVAPYESFQSLDIRVDRIVQVKEARTANPTYKMTIDFGPEMGTKVSCGAYRNYAREQLLGKQIIAVVNFPPKKMGPEISEVIVLGVANAKGEII